MYDPTDVKPKLQKFKKLLLNKRIEKVELSRGVECDNLTLTLVDIDEEAMSRCFGDQGTRKKITISAGSIYADLFITQLRDKK